MLFMKKDVKRPKILWKPKTDVNRELSPEVSARKDTTWDTLKSYVQNDARIQLNTYSLKQALMSYDDTTLSSTALKHLISTCVQRHVKNDESKLDAVVDYLELLDIVLPLTGDVNSPNQKYIINVEGELQEDVERFSEKTELLENIKSYVKLLIK
jgi:hypothetical protein